MKLFTWSPTELAGRSHKIWLVQWKQLIRTTQSVLWRSEQLWDLRRLFGVDCLGWTNPSTCFRFCWSFLQWQLEALLKTLWHLPCRRRSGKHRKTSESCEMRLWPFHDAKVMESPPLVVIWIYIGLPTFWQEAQPFCLHHVSTLLLVNLFVDSHFGRCFALVSLPWSPGGDEQQS